MFCLLTLVQTRVGNLAWSQAKARYLASFIFRMDRELDRFLASFSKWIEDRARNLSSFYLALRVSYEIRTFKFPQNRWISVSDCFLYSQNNYGFLSSFLSDLNEKKKRNLWPQVSLYSHFSFTFQNHVGLLSSEQVVRNSSCRRPAMSVYDPSYSRPDWGNCVSSIPRHLQMTLCRHGRQR